MDLNLPSSKHALCSLVGKNRHVASGVAQLRSGEFYSLLFIALVLEKLGGKTLKLKELAKRQNSASIAESSSSDDTSPACAEATNNGKSSKPVDIVASRHCNTSVNKREYVPLTRQEAKDLRARYECGETVVSLAKAFKLSRWACYKIINFRSHRSNWGG